MAALYSVGGESLSTSTYDGNLAETFSSLKAYKVGDYVLYNGVLYVCKTNHNGTWNESNWTREYVIDIIIDLLEDLEEAREQARNSVAIDVGRCTSLQIDKSSTYAATFTATFDVSDSSLSFVSTSQSGDWDVQSYISITLADDSSITQNTQSVTNNGTITFNGKKYMQIKAWFNTGNYALDSHIRFNIDFVKSKKYGLVYDISIGKDSTYSGRLDAYFNVSGLKTVNVSSGGSGSWDRTITVDDQPVATNGTITFNGGSTMLIHQKYNTSNLSENSFVQLNSWT